jgi:hypothetical protein
MWRTVSESLHELSGEREEGCIYDFDVFVAEKCISRGNVTKINIIQTDSIF